jgi:seryl-tRNA synthetase
VIDPTLLRSDTDVLRRALARRDLEVDLDELIGLDEERRKARTAAEELRAEQKQAGKAISGLEGDEKQLAIEAAGRLSDAYKAELGEADRLDTLFHEQWLPLPNIADESVPDGAGEEDNLEIKRWGTPTEFDFPIRDHLDLGEALGVIDVERAAKASGARFNYLKGRLALMEFALVRWAMERLSAEGFTPVVPPVLVREAALVGTGFFPGDRDQVYEIGADELFLAGTAEIPLAAMHLDEILDSADLPRRYVGFSTCFRREAGTYGRDTRGILRQHQFDKVEMFSFSRAEDSPQEHEFLLEREEALVQELGLPYRVVNVCIGDLGAPAAKKYDIEVWLPGEQAYRELTSCSNTTDYQARRLKIRHKGDGPASLVHTLNGTATAIGRTLIAIMENYQQEDGTVRVPEALVPFAGFEAITAT